MTGASMPVARTPGSHGGGSSSNPTTHDPRDLWPREFGRDGVSGLLSLDRALRARDVSRPDADDERFAAGVINELLARVDGRRRPHSAGRR